MPKLIDLTQTIVHSMPVYPGEQPPSLTIERTLEADGYTCYRLDSAMHAGTHMDAPMHVFDDRRFIGSFDVSLFTGTACVIDVRGENPVNFRSEWREFFEKNEIVLFFTGHDRFFGLEPYYDQYPDFDAGIARELVRHGVRIAGFDSPSPDRMPYDFHMTFLDGTRFLLEGLTNLIALPTGRSFRLFAFPLKIEAEASLIRVVAEVD